MQPKKGGRSHPKLNISGRPIAKKYSDGKVKRTLKRRSKVLEIVKRETNVTGKFSLGGNLSFGRVSRLAVRAGLFGRPRLDACIFLGMYFSSTGGRGRMDGDGKSVRKGMRGASGPLQLQAERRIRPLCPRYKENASAG